MPTCFVQGCKSSDFQNKKAKPEDKRSLFHATTVRIWGYHNSFDLILWKIAVIINISNIFSTYYRMKSYKRGEEQFQTEKIWKRKTSFVIFISRKMISSSVIIKAEL